MIAVNDNYADGRDMSWLWDVEFESLRTAGVSTVTGVRAYDMALRLQYDEIAIASVEPDLPNALRQFLASSDSPKRVFCTYTAMLALRRELGKITDVEQIS
jgi:UDP-N-acetylmuramyl tripeptide synthase